MKTGEPIAIKQTVVKSKISTFLPGFAVLLALLAGACVEGRAQGDEDTATGTISGKVVDTRSGDPIIGANVLLVETSRGDATDIDGKFSISKIEPGTYSLRFSYISHRRKTVTEVTVRGGEVTTLNVSLQPQTVGLDEITVTAAMNNSSEAGLLSLQEKASAVQDGLSAEQLSRSGAGNVAMALKQVSGVSVMGRNDVYVRGLGNRYSNVQLDGSPVPSTSPDKKQAPVDLLGSGVVDHIVVQKTFTPDQAGEFSGGSVQIATREFPPERKFGFSYSTSYNTVSNAGDMLSYEGSPTDFLGYDNGYRKLPAEVRDGRISGPGEAAEVRRKMHDRWTPGEFSALPAQKLGLNYANRFNEEKMPVGLVTSFNYKYDVEARPSERYRYIQNHNPNTSETSIGADYTTRSGRRNTHLSGMANLFLKPTSDSRIGLKSLYSNSSTREARIIEGEYYNYDGVNRQTILGFEQRSVYSTTLSYQGYFHEAMESELDVSLAYSRAAREIPDRRNAQLAQTEGDAFELMLSDRGNFHFFSSQDDHHITGKADYRFRPSDRVMVKAGGLFLLKNRDFGAFRLLYRDLDNELNTSQRLMGPERLFTAEHINSGELELVESTQPYDSYRGEQQLTAAYLSTRWHPGEALSLEGGLRLEHSRQSIDGRSLIGETDLLPAFNATYSLGEQANLRGAFSITLARPEFRELSNFNFRDFIGGRTVYGNPDLERTRIYNADLRYEIYPGAEELLAASLFYKKFKNPIELSYRITQNNEVMYVNVPEADLYGAELELRKNFTDRLRLSANFSWIFSTVSYTDEQAVARQANSERPMYGQSPFTLNGELFYRVPVIGLETHLSYNTFGPRISAVGNAQQPDDEYEQPFHRLNLNVSRTIGSATLSLGIENLLGDEVHYRQGNVTTTRYEVGRTVTAGVSFSF